MSQQNSIIAAIVGMIALAAADAWLNRGSRISEDVVVGLLGWMSHRAISPPNPPA